MMDGKQPFDPIDRTEILSDPGRDSFELVAEEFVEQCRRGVSHSIADFERRYPEHAARIRELLPTIALMEQLKRGGQRDRSADTSTTPLPDRLGEYRVRRELGRGGMGVVYEAVQESLGRTVALKVIHHIHLNAKRLQRFQREAQAVARLHHTNIVPIFGVGEHDGLPYYVMQYIEGSGLDRLVESWRVEGSKPDPAHWRFVARVGVQAAEALEHAHGQGILHRDIKPANLLVDQNETIWVTDFGLAKLTGHDDLTASGDIVGTLRYIAPEALKGETDHRSDVYSLGLTLYELLTLNAPFGDLSPSELLKRVSEAGPIQPRKLAPAIPGDLETIVLKATAREPAHRYPTARALADDLNRFLEDRPIHARRANPFERAWRWGRRNRLAAAMSVTALAAVLIATVVGWTGYVLTARALDRANRNVALSLEVFGELFDQLAAHDRISTPPLGETDGGPGPGPGPGPDGHGRPPFGDRGPKDFDGPPPEGGGPPDHRPGLDGGPRRGPPGSPWGGESEGDTMLLQSVLAFYDRFAVENAANPRLEGEAAWAYRKVGALYERLHREADAELAYDRAISMFESLVSRYPHDLEYRSKLIQTYDLANPRVADPSSLDRLERWLRRAQVLVDQLVADAPDEEEFTSFQIRVYVKLGETLARQGRLDEAEARFRQAIAIEGRAMDGSARNFGLWIDRATTREALALIKLDRGRRAEAKQLLDEAISDLEVLENAYEPVPPIQPRLRSLAESYRKLGETARADEVGRMADRIDSGPRRPPLGPRGGPDRRKSATRH